MHQAAADGVNAGRDDNGGPRHRLKSASQRRDHAGGADTRGEQDVSVPRAGGEEDAEPMDVVDGIEQRENFPLVGAVRTRDEASARDLTAEMFAGVLDDPRNAEHLSARVVWADVDELTLDEDEPDDAKGDTAWTSA